MAKSILIITSMCLAAAAPLWAGPILAVTAIEGGPSQLLHGGAFGGGGAHLSITMLSADPATPLFSLSASAYGFARVGELSVQTVAVAAGAADTGGQLRATASSSYQDTLSVNAAGRDGEAGYLVMLWREPPAGGMRQVTGGSLGAQACAGPCSSGFHMRAIAPGFMEIGRLPFFFGEVFSYTVAMSGAAGVSWGAERHDYAYAAAVGGLDASQLYVGVLDGRGRLLGDAEWYSYGGLSYAAAPEGLIHNPEPATWALLGAGLAVLASVRRRRPR